MILLDAIPFFNTAGGSCASGIDFFVFIWCCSFRQIDTTDIEKPNSFSIQTGFRIISVLFLLQLAIFQQFLEESKCLLSSKVFNTFLCSNEAQQESSAEKTELTESETFEKINQHLAHLEALTVSKCCQRLNLDYKAHLTSHTSATVEKSQSSAEKSPVKSDESELPRITRGRLEAHVKAKAASNTTSRQ